MIAVDGSNMLIAPARLVAAQVLTALGTEAPLDLLLSLLDDPDMAVRREALQALKAFGVAVPVEALRHVAENPNDDRDLQLKVLRMDKGMLDDLRARGGGTVIPGATMELRARVMETLGAIGTDEAIEVLIEQTRTGPANLRAAALRALADCVPVPSPELTTLITEVVRKNRQDTDFNIQLAFEEASAQSAFTEEALPIERYREPEQVCAATAHLIMVWAAHGSLDAELMEYVVELVVAHEGNDLHNTWNEVVQALIALKEGTAHVDALLRVLHEVSLPDERREAAHLLGLLHAPVPLDPLLSALHDDPDEWVQYTVAVALGQRHRRNPQEVPANILIAQLLPLLSHPNAEARRRAIAGLYALGEQTPPQVITALLEQLYADDPNERRQAAWYLNNLGVATPVSELSETPDDVDTDSEFIEELDALNLGEQTPVETLIAILDDLEANINRDQPLPYARTAAAYALGERGEHAAIDSLIRAFNLENSFETATLRATAVEALGKMGEHAPLDIIRAAFGDDEAQVRRAAARASGYLGSKELLPNLLEAIGDHGSAVNGTVAAAALSALKEIAPETVRELLPEAIAVLRGEQLGPHIGAYAQAILPVYEASRAALLARRESKLDLTHLNLLIERLDSPHWQVRRGAAGGLCTIARELDDLDQLKRALPTHVLPRLRELQHDPVSSAMRQAATEALLYLGAQENQENP